MTTTKMADHAGDRLFVPLNGEHFWNFVLSGKTWELRGVNDNFNRTTVTEGRAVELRLGYDSPYRLWGTIGKRELFGSYSDLVYRVGHDDRSPDVDDILPGAALHRFAVSVLETLGDGYNQYIAFRPDGLDRNPRAKAFENHSWSFKRTRVNLAHDYDETMPLHIPADRPGVKP